MAHDPVVDLERWVEQARAAGDPAGSTMVLATADGSGAPSARVVLLKGIRDGELVFGTSLDSRKGRELRARPEVALVLFWPARGRQARVAGRAVVTSRAETERVWAARGRDGRLVDHVSDEGASLEDAAALRAAFEAADAELGEDVPCAADWAAVRVRPDVVELWEEGERRLAVRRLFERSGSGWRLTRLQP